MASGANICRLSGLAVCLEIASPKSARQPLPAGDSHGQDLTIQHKSRSCDNPEYLRSLFGHLMDLDLQPRKFLLNLLGQRKSKLLRQTPAMDKDFQDSHVPSLPEGFPSICKPAYTTLPGRAVRLVDCPWEARSRKVPATNCSVASAYVRGTAPSRRWQD